MSSTKSLRDPVRFSSCESGSKGPNQCGSFWIRIIWQKKSLLPVLSSRTFCARRQRRPLRSGGLRLLGSSPPGSFSSQPRIELVKIRWIFNEKEKGLVEFRKSAKYICRDVLCTSCSTSWFLNLFHVNLGRKIELIMTSTIKPTKLSKFGFCYETYYSEFCTHLIRPNF